MNHTKRCSKCQGEFPATLEFFNKKLSKLTTRCKECLRLDSREAYKKQQQKTHNYTDGTKKCTGCKNEFPATLEFFSKKISGKYGVTAKCKNCSNEYNREMYAKHQEKRLEAKKEYGKKNKDGLKQRNRRQYLKNREARIEYAKQYAESNKDAIRGRARKYMINKYHSDTHLKIKMNLSRRMRSFFSKDGDSTIDFIGCSIDELKLHLEKQFVDGMNWENYGMYGWHVDHIRPCCSFDLTDKEQQRKCFHYTNLQPLWAKDNLAKGGSFHE